MDIMLGLGFWFRGGDSPELQFRVGFRAAGSFLRFSEGW